MRQMGGPRPHTSRGWGGRINASVTDAVICEIARRAQLWIWNADHAAGRLGSRAFDAAAGRFWRSRNFRDCHLRSQSITFFGFASVTSYTTVVTSDWLMLDHTFPTYLWGNFNIRMNCCSMNEPSKVLFYNNACKGIINNLRLKGTHYIQHVVVVALIKYYVSPND